MRQMGSAGKETMGSNGNNPSRATPMRMVAWVLVGMSIVSSAGITAYYAYGEPQPQPWPGDEPEFGLSRPRAQLTLERSEVDRAVVEVVFNRESGYRIEEDTSDRYSLSFHADELTPEIFGLAWISGGPNAFSKGYASLSLPGPSGYHYYLIVNAPMEPRLDSLDLTLARIDSDHRHSYAFAKPTVKDTACMRVAVAKLAWEIAQSRHLLAGPDQSLRASHLNGVFCLQEAGLKLGLRWIPWISFDSVQIDEINAYRSKQGWALVAQRVESSVPSAADHRAK